MERLTPIQKDERYGPVYSLMVKAREAHSALTKAKHNNTSEEEVQKLVANVRAADEAVRQAVAAYTPDDVKLLLAYSSNAIIQDALTLDGKGGMTWDVNKSRWAAKTLMSIPAGIGGTRENPAYQRMVSVETFVKLFATLGLTPRYGINDRSVRFGVSVLLKEVEKTRNGGDRAQAGNLNQLYNEVTKAFPRSWFEERERPASPPQTAAATIGEQVGQVVVDAAVKVVAEGPAPKRTARRPR